MLTKAEAEEQVADMRARTQVEEAAAEERASVLRRLRDEELYRKVLALLALLVHKYKY